MSIFFAKNFKYSEMACPHCGKDRPIDSRLAYLLQALRDKINKPIYITTGGGIRCVVYNKQIKGFVDSPHLYGLAVDIYAKGMSIIELAMEAYGIGFERMGLYPYNGFAHLDVVKSHPSKSWVRNKKGKYVYFNTLEKAIDSIK